VGRDPQADVSLPQPEVSWHHARLKRQGLDWHLQDLNSANGTFVDGQKVDQCVLRAGDRIQIGLSRLALDEDQLSLKQGAAQLHIEARGLGRTICKNGQSHELLRDVSLHIRPCEMVAIAGATGAGKSTLLRALCGATPATSGQVLINGVDFYSHRGMFRSAVGYVPQDDIVHQELTVYSALQHAARLRLPRDTHDEEVTAAVARVLCELGIEERRNHQIHTLSGGERKRVNIGVELLSRPGALFLDEPTTGLDAGFERRVTQLLRELANQGRTVVVVTHAAATLEQYDKVAFLARGGVLAFYGSPREALRFFGARDFAAVYDILNEGARDFAGALNTHDGVAFSPLAALPEAGSGAPGRQLATLWARSLEIMWSDKRNLWLWLAQAPFVAFLITLLFDNQTFARNQSPGANGHWPIHDATRLLFLMAFSMVCFSLCNAAREIVKERPIYRRERQVALNIEPYLLSKICLFALLGLVQSALLLGIVALQIPFYLNGSEMITAWLLLFLGALNAVLLGLLVSALASSADQAITAVAVLLLMQVLFSGLVPLDRLPDSLRWLSTLCATRWTYGGLCGLTDLSARWSAIGPGARVDDVMKTAPGVAVNCLVLLAGAQGAALWGALKWRD
jgi:ABC-type multidrug transport system ATPase subunit